MPNNVTYKVLGPQSAGLPDNTIFRTVQNADGSHSQSLVEGFEIPPYNKIELDPPSETPTTITYSLNGTIIAVLELTWSGGYLASVERTT